MRIDAHQHFWRYAPATHGWIDDTMPGLRRDFLPEDLEPLLHGAGFAGSIAVQAAQDPSETEWLLALSDAHAFIRGVVGWVDLTADDVRDRLARVAAHPRLCGIRHIVQAEPEGFMLRADFQRGIAALAEFGLTYDILIYARQLDEAAALVRAFPAQPFVLDHIAKPDIRGGGHAPWRRGIEALARSDNVTCKLSGMVTEADWAAWTAGDLAPYIDTVFECFGPRRLLAGSDWPVCTLAADYGRVMDVVLERVATLDEDEREAVLGGNALRVYRM